MVVEGTVVVDLISSLASLVTLLKLLRRALLAVVCLTTGALTELIRTGLALNEGLLLLSTCSFSFSAPCDSRLRRSSRCALSFAEAASPGKVKVEVVGGLLDLAGTKGSFEMEETRGLGRWASDCNLVEEDDGVNEDLVKGLVSFGGVCVLVVKRRAAVDLVAG